MSLKKYIHSRSRKDFWRKIQNSSNIIFSKSQSTYSRVANKRAVSNRFTGWKDVPLTEKGINEANNAGLLLKKNNIKIDKVFSSILERANRTAEIALKASEIKNLFENGKLIYEKDKRGKVQME